MGNYPKIKDGESKYVKYPVIKDGLWYAADVLVNPNGYSISPLAIGFEDKERCERGCKVINSYNGFTEEERLSIIALSMTN